MNTYNSFKNFYVKNYLQLLPACIIIIACVGSFVVYYLTLEGLNAVNFFLLFLCTTAAMSYLASVLAQLPRRVSFLLFVIGMIVELALLVVSMVF